MLIVDAAIVMLPPSVLGVRLFRSVSMNTKSLGYARQINDVLAPGVLLIRVMFRLNSVPAPESGVKPSSEKDEMRNVRMDPGPVFKTFPETFQLLAVSPAAATGGTWKLITVESKVKSP